MGLLTMKKQAKDLQKGDITITGDEVMNVVAGLHTPSGKVEVTLKTKSGKTKTAMWGKTTTIGIKSKEEVRKEEISRIADLL